MRRSPVHYRLYLRRAGCRPCVQETRVPDLCVKKGTQLQRGNLGIRTAHPALLPSAGRQTLQTRQCAGRVEQPAAVRIRGCRAWADINGTIRGGGFASYTLGWFTVRGSALYDLEDHHNHEGLLGSLEAIARYSPLARLTLTAGPVSFGNQRYMQTFFGINALQSQRSGYAEYTPKGGVALIGFSVGAGYELTSHWSIGARVAAERLQGDAGRSRRSGDLAHSAAACQGSSCRP